MFSQKKIILTFTNGSIFVAKVSVKSGKASLLEKTEVQWNAKTLTSVLKTVKKKYGSAVRLLLPESKTYLKLLSLSQDELSRSLILKKMQEIVPEPVEEDSFDWKIVEKKDKEYLIQAAAVNKEYIKRIKTSAEEAKIQIEAAEPLSFALARLTQKEKEPHMIISLLQEKIICAAFKGEVYESLVLEPQDNIDASVEKLASYTAKNWGVEIKKVFKDLPDPAISLALKKDVKGEDAASLNLTNSKQIQPKETPKKEDDQPSSSSKIVLLVLAVIVIAGIVAAAFFLLPKIKKTNTASQEAKITASPTAAPSIEPTITPTPTILPDKDRLKISLANGGGLANEAANARDFLMSLGYIDITVGNADSFDYEKTIVRLKEEKENYSQMLKEDLSKRYETDEQIYPLDKDDSYDVQIIIGSLIK